MSAISKVFDGASLRLKSWRALIHARGSSRRVLHERHAERLLIVCYGNIYRSPFVEAFIRQSVHTGIQVRSAGFHAVADRPSPDRHVSMSRDFGVSLAGHRSRVIGKADLEWADVIVLMDRLNWARLRVMGAEPGKLVWLGAFQKGSVEIPDPYGLGEDEARRVLERLNTASEALCLELATRG
jgi:protein-tyrosine-phosphatase